MSINSSIVVHTYANAFLSAGVHEDSSHHHKMHQADNILKQASEDKRYIIVFNNRTLSLEDKIKFLQKHIGEPLESTILNLMKILKKNNRMTLFLSILRASLVLDSIERGGLPVKFCTSSRLTEKQEKDFVDIFSKVFNKKIIPDFLVDPSILGGFKVYYEDKLIDSSWSYRLFILQQHVEGILV